MLEEMKKLTNEKLDLEVRYLGRLEELKKSLGDISELQEKITSNQLEIHTLGGDRLGTHREAEVKAPSPMAGEGFGAQRG